MSRYADLIPQQTQPAPVQKQGFFSKLFGSKQADAPAPAPETQPTSQAPTETSRYADLIPKGAQVPAAQPRTSRYSDLIPAQPVQAQPAQPTSLMDKASSFGSKILNKVNDIITPPTEKSFEGTPVGTSNINYTIKYLPSEIARNLPIIGSWVTELQDNPDVLNYVEGKDFAKAIPEGAKEYAKFIAKTPVRVGLGLYDAVTGKKTSVNVPVLGEASSPGKAFNDRVAQGEDPVVAALSEGTNAIFDVLFFAGVSQGLVSPRPKITSTIKTDATSF